MTRTVFPRHWSVAALAASVALAGCSPAARDVEAALVVQPDVLGKSQKFEVWLVDQSNTNGTGYGGYIHIYDGADLMGESAASATAERIDLGGAVSSLCLAKTGANPVRPHMVVFNHGDTHAALAFVATGHVVFFDARTRQPLDCVRMAAGAGGARQAHAVWPTDDDRYVLVANQNGKRFERVRTDWANNQFTYEPASALDLANCTTPTGRPCQAPNLRPDNAPICPFTAKGSKLSFVSLRGGGMFIVDPTTTPISIVAEYDAVNVHGNGCGYIEAQGHVYFNGGGGTANNLDGFVVYRVRLADIQPHNAPNTPVRELLFEDEGPRRDAHGVAVTKHESYVWMLDRAADVAEIFHGATGQHFQTVDLRSDHSAKPTPDLAALSPSGNRMFLSLRGPTPLSGDPHASTGSTPGLGVVQLQEGGASGLMKAIVPVTNRDAGGVERADPHGIRLRLK